jgi:hypothetical protein
VCELAIIVYARRFEQRTNEIEHSKLIKQGFPIVLHEQVRVHSLSLDISLFVMSMSIQRVVTTIMAA